jgi:glycosyltransferase involved in cell wall biosynthesis
VLAGHRTADLGYLVRLRALIRAHDVRLIHAHLLASSVYGSLVARITGLPVVCTFHGMPDFPEHGRLLSAKLRIIQRRRNRIVFVSRTLRDTVLARHAIAESLCRVIHNGIALREPAVEGTERAELGAAEGAFLALAVGNLRPTKDYATLLRAAALVRDAGVPLRLAILGEGEGPLRDTLEAERTRLGLDDVVLFAGFRPDAARFLAEADVYVSSSTTEGFSLSTVEALWLTRPVVATRSGGPEEIVRDGETGRLVPVGDPEALSRALIEVWEYRARARSRAEHGRGDVLARFSQETMIARYEALYDELLELG